MNKTQIPSTRQFNYLFYRRLLCKFWRIEIYFFQVVISFKTSRKGSEDVRPHLKTKILFELQTTYLIYRQSCWLNTRIPGDTAERAMV